MRSSRTRSKDLFGAECLDGVFAVLARNDLVSCSRSRSVRPSRSACSSSTMRTRMPQDNGFAGSGRQDPVKQDRFAVRSPDETGSVGLRYPG